MNKKSSFRSEISRVTQTDTPGLAEVPTVKCRLRYNLAEINCIIKQKVKRTHVRENNLMIIYGNKSDHPFFRYIPNSEKEVLVDSAFSLKTRIS